VHARSLCEVLNDLRFSNGTLESPVPLSVSRLSARSVFGRFAAFSQSRLARSGSNVVADDVNKSYKHRTGPLTDRALGCLDDCFYYETGSRARFLLLDPRAAGLWQTPFRKRLRGGQR
jgi:hypothetical protein